MAFDSLPTVETVEGAVVTGWANGGHTGLNFHDQYYGVDKEGQPYPAYDYTNAWVSLDMDTESEEWAKAVKVKKAVNIAIGHQALVEELLSGFGRDQSVRDWMGHYHRENPD